MFSEDEYRPRLCVLISAHRETEVLQSDNSTGLMGLSIVLFIGSHKRSARFSKRHGMVQGIEDMLFQRCRKVAGFVVDLHAHHDGKLKRMEKRDGLTSTVWVKPHDHCRNLRQPVRRLSNGDAGFFDELENLKCLEGMRFVGSISEDPLDDHAGIENDRRHGLPRLLAARTARSVIRLVRFRNVNNFSTALALRRRRRRSSTACRMSSVSTALLFCRLKALSNASFTSDGTLKFTVAIAGLSLLKISTTG